MYGQAACQEGSHSPPITPMHPWEGFLNPCTQTLCVSLSFFLTPMHTALRHPTSFHLSADVRGVRVTALGCHPGDLNLVATMVNALLSMTMHKIMCFAFEAIWTSGFVPCVTQLRARGLRASFVEPLSTADLLSA